MNPKPPVRIGALRLLAITLIYFAAAIAWVILGATIESRTRSSDNHLRERVGMTWGLPQEQGAPSGLVEYEKLQTYLTQENGRNVEKLDKTTETVPMELEHSAVDVKIDLAHRQKGLLWYATYAVDFRGTYVLHNTSAKGGTAKLSFPLPTPLAIYDGLEFRLSGNPVEYQSTPKGPMITVPMKPGEAVELKAAYRSQGLDQWRYRFSEREETGNNQRVAKVKDFVLRMTTNFADIDFADNTLSPSAKRQLPGGGGWELEWKYSNLVSGFQIALVMPEKLQPGPLAGEISYFAPVSLFFFFFILLILTTIRDIELHPMNYFFLAAAFFAFHLLMAYLVDHIDIHWAFAIAAATSVFLVVSYLRLVCGLRFAAVEAGGAQLLYLILFSYAFFFKGLTGLAITIGSVLTLFIVMQTTGRIRWSDKFGGSQARQQATPAPLG